MPHTHPRSGSGAGGKVGHHPVLGQNHISQRPALPSIASSSLYLTPIQEQRILSWRSHAATSPVPTPDHHADPMQSCDTPQTPMHSGDIPSPSPAPNASQPRIRSAPASLAPQAHGGPGTQQSSRDIARGNSEAATNSRPNSPVTVPSAYPQMSQRPNLNLRPKPKRTPSSRSKHDTNPVYTSPSASPTSSLHEDDHQHSRGFRHVSGSNDAAGGQIRSYYSTKKYRQAKIAEMRMQSGYGSVME